MLMPFETFPTAVEHPSILQRFTAVRSTSVSLTSPLSAEDCAAQSMPDASPAKWHLAHTTWFFETFILEIFEPDFKPFHDAFRVLFNSYYNGVGEKYARAQRGLLTRPSHAQVLAYRENVDSRMVALLTSNLSSHQQSELAGLVELGLQHEQQHQELILTDIQHLLSMNPLFPSYANTSPAPSQPVPQSWIKFPASIVEIGHTGESFHFDNEMPWHRQFCEAYALSSRLVTNAEYAAFIADGGYRNPAFWLSDGWDFLKNGNITHPIYWRCDEADQWQAFSSHGLHAVDPNAAVTHLSYYEAAAYAHWAGARLPTEAEWESAASHASLSQMFGTAWQWTSSSYSPYPGFITAAGAIGEYNGKFMVNQYALRGSSAATPAGHSRPTYRNFFPASARWQFTGIRLAR
jgi:ergothioneine biosynthesis protein EgtB